jgi:hypothetical protein
MKVFIAITHMPRLKRVKWNFGGATLDKKAKGEFFYTRKFFNIFVAYVVLFATFAHSRLA